MDRVAIEMIATEWLSAVSESAGNLAWVKNARTTAYPAFLVDETTKEGDDYKAGAVPIAVDSDPAPTAEMVDALHEAVVADRTLGRRAKRAYFERPSGSNAGTLVIVPL